MMRRLPALLPIVLLALSAAGCSKKGERQKGSAEAVVVSSQARGEALFQQRCLDCHRVRRQGGSVGPELTTIGSRRDASYLQEVIRQPNRVFPGTVMPPGDSLSVGQLNSLVDYLRSLKQSSVATQKRR